MKKNKKEKTVHARADLGTNNPRIESKSVLCPGTNNPRMECMDLMTLHARPCFGVCLKIETYEKRKNPRSTDFESRNRRVTVVSLLFDERKN
jgi:hypothetical protein